MATPEERLPSLFIIPMIQFFVGLFLFIALLNGQTDLTILTLLILGLMGGAKWWSRLSLSGIKCHSKVDRQRVFPGEKLHLEIGAENGKFLPVWLQMRLPIDPTLHPSSDDASSDEAAFTKGSGLLWYQRVRFQWTLSPKQRGVFQIGPPHMKVGDPFGFFSKEKDVKESLDLIVYPRLVPLKAFSFPRRDFFGRPGAGSPVQDPIYILGTRDYQQGQPARYIHWKASARHSRLQEKVFEPSEQEKILIVVEVDRFAKNEAHRDFEQTIEIAASLAVRLNQLGFAVGLATNGAVVGDGPNIQPLARNPAQMSAILEVLARLRMEPRGEIQETMRRGLALPWGVSCVYFSFEENEQTPTIEKYFNYRKIPLVFFMCRHHTLTGENGRQVRSRIRRLDDLSMTRIDES